MVAHSAVPAPDLDSGHIAEQPEKAETWKGRRQLQGLPGVAPLPEGQANGKSLIADLLSFL